MRKVIRYIQTLVRAKRIADKARSNFDSVVYSCSDVSRTNHEICFIVRRLLPFGCPAVERISRPDVVVLTEIDNCVVIKDGTIYELNKTPYGQRY